MSKELWSSLPDVCVILISDPEVESMMAPYRAKVELEGNKTIARSAVKLDGSCRGQECNFGMKCNKSHDYEGCVLKEGQLQN